MSCIKTALRQYAEREEAGKKVEPTLEDMQRQLKRWSTCNRKFGGHTYGTIETIHDGLGEDPNSSKFEHAGSGPIGKHLRLLRQQFQELGEKLDHLAAQSATMPSLGEELQFQLLQEDLQQRADMIHIMYFAFNEALVSSQLANQISRDNSVQLGLDAIAKLEHELQATKNENRKLKAELATACEKSQFLNYRVRELTPQLTTKRSVLDGAVVDTEVENQAPNTHTGNCKRQKSDPAGNDALTDVDN